jgi:hypothetical protein
MPKDAIAQRLLESVTTHDRAVSTLGDLRETAATRGEVWFWWNVLGTAAALSWRGLAANPRAVFRPAIGAWFLNLGLEVIVYLLGMLLFGYVQGRLSHSGQKPWGAPYLSAIIFLALVSVCQYLIGWWIGRRAPASAMSVCLAFTLLQVAIEYPLLFAMPPSQGALSAATLNFLTHAFCFLGALSSRTRTAHA